jgi:hypothetical protein
MLPTKIHKTLVIPTNGRNLLFRSLRDKSARGRLMWSGRPRPLPLLLVLSLKLSLKPAPDPRPDARTENWEGQDVQSCRMKSTSKRRETMKRDVEYRFIADS